MNTTSDRKAVFSIQYLRGLAALLVVFHHSLNQFPAFKAEFPTHIGAAGVDIFFVISGFVMTYSSSLNRCTASEFLIRRAIRIVPLYWVLTLLTAALLATASELVRNSTFETTHLALSLLFIPHENPGLEGSLSPMIKVGWTLNYEIFFYLAFALLISFSDIRRTVALIVVFLIFVFSVRIIEPSIAPLRFWGNAILFEFVLGCLIAHLYLSGTFHKLNSYVFFALIAAGVMIIFSFGTYYDPGWHRLFYFGVGGALLVAGCVGLESQSSQLRNYGFWLFIGGASYSIYLVHLYAVIFFRIIWERGGFATSGLGMSVAFITLCVVFGAVSGLIIYTCLERPLTNWCRNFVAKQKNYGLKFTWRHIKKRLILNSNMKQ